MGAVLTAVMVLFVCVEGAVVYSVGGWVDGGGSRLVTRDWGRGIYSVVRTWPNG